jgi:hypothetical protein
VQRIPAWRCLVAPDETAEKLVGLLTRGS